MEYPFLLAEITVTLLRSYKVELLWDLCHYSPINKTIDSTYGSVDGSCVSVYKSNDLVETVTETKK